MGKILTIAIPAYNAEAYLAKALESLLVKTELGRLDIIIINDGSTDGTPIIAENYAASYPESIRLINKANGGHGSGINAAVAIAVGKYFRVLDADDWIISENLKRFLAELEKSTADIMINNYHTVHLQTGKRVEYSVECSYAGSTMDLDRFMQVFPRVGPACTIHGMTYRLDTYKSAGFELSEKIFYEDNEYAILPFSRIETVQLLPLPLYQYQIGNAEQSVAFTNQVKRSDQLLRVIERIIEYHKAVRLELSSAAEEYFLAKLGQVCVSYLAICLIKNADRQSGREQAERFWRYLSEEEPKVLHRIAKKHRMMRIFHQLHLSPRWYQQMMDTNIYGKFRSIWMR